MQFKDLGINDQFTKQGSPVVYTKVPEQKVSCCKVSCNAKDLRTNTNVVFRPLDEVTKVEK